MFAPCYPVVILVAGWCFASTPWLISPISAASVSVLIAKAAGLLDRHALEMMKDKGNSVRAHLMECGHLKCSLGSSLPTIFRDQILPGHGHVQFAPTWFARTGEHSMCLERWKFVARNRACG